MNNKRNGVERKRTLRDILVDFMGYTTGHGFARLVAATSIAWRIFWVVAVLGATGMFAFQVADLFKLFLARPVQTSVTVALEKKLKFPAVTICNLNMIKKSKMGSLPLELFDDFKLNTTEKPSETVKSSTQLISTTEGVIVTQEPSAPISSTAEIIGRKKREIKEDEFVPPGEYTNWYDTSSLEEDESYEDISDEFPPINELRPQEKLRIRVDSHLGVQDPPNLFPLGHQYRDLIKNCTWKGADCAHGSLITSAKAMPVKGLVLKLDIEENEYVGELTEEAGVRVVLHEQGVMRFPFEEGFSVAPGMATSVGLTRTMMKKLDRFSNGSCTDESIQLTQHNLYKKNENVTRYSLQTTKLLADIGGQVGLWIGISALTCVEVLELLFQIISFAYMKCKSGRENRVIKIGDTTE
ncbi:amiloride-sensitive sodium channel subunit gamma-like [Dendronephthya gigantea]|uniref:amiloride-sensitive sodium channel subunit gamma-like n=1 Tax=Dendronephthya gigantea TaxID=151771 RepID=UPI00106CB08C|nr:amiloride-sensitive sodium channel subunit gamma-like [Dendronephthya gigantea]